MELECGWVMRGLHICAHSSSRKQTLGLDYSFRCCVTDCCHLLLAASQPQQLHFCPLTGRWEAINIFVPLVKPAADWIYISPLGLRFPTVSAFWNETRMREGKSNFISSPYIPRVWAKQLFITVNEHVYVRSMCWLKQLVLLTSVSVFQ